MTYFYCENWRAFCSSRSVDERLQSLKKDTLRHNCTHDDITEMPSGISKLNLSGVKLMISTRVDEMFSFWIVIWIMLTKFQTYQPSHFWKKIYYVINLPKMSYLKSCPAYLSEIFMAYYWRYLRKQMKYFYSEEWHEFCWSRSCDIRRKNFQKDALRHNYTHDVISEIMPGLFKLNFSGILLAIYTKVDDIF